VADTTVRFSVKLDDDVSASAKSSAAALEQLQQKIQADQKALSEMNRALRRIKGSTSVSGKSITDLKDKIAAQKEVLGRNQQAFLDMGGGFDMLANKAKPPTAATGKMGGMLGQMAASAGPAIAALGAVTAGFAAVAAGAVAVGAALTAVIAPIVAVTGKLLQLGVAASEAARSERLHFEGLASIRKMYGLVAQGAAGMQTAIDRVSSRVAAGRGELVSYAQRLQRLGVTGKNFELALEAAGKTAAVQGDRYGRRMLMMAAATARAGGSVQALADDVEARLGPINTRLMAGLGKMSEKLRENIGNIFKGLRIEGFLSKLFEMSQILSQNNVVGQALRKAFETLFQPMIDGATKHLPAIKESFLLFSADVLNGVASIFRALTGLKKALGIKSFQGLIDMQAIAQGLAFAFLFWLRSIESTVKALTALTNAIKAIWKLRPNALGRALTDGISQGVKSGEGSVISTMRSLASKAQGAFESALKIQSPSKVFAGLGEQIPRGIAAGVDSASPVADTAVAQVAQPPALSAGAAAGGQRVYLSFGDINIAGGEGSDGQSLAQGFRDELAKALEGVSIELGGATGRA